MGLQPVPVEACCDGLHGKVCICLSRVACTGKSHWCTQQYSIGDVLQCYEPVLWFDAAILWIDAMQVSISHMSFPNGLSGQSECLVSQYK